MGALFQTIVDGCCVYDDILADETLLKMELPE